jgi:predicted DNA-binding WGR domain protein
VSGVSWKVWKIKRQGRVVETRWGPIKVVNRRMVHAKVLPRKKWPAFATIEAAKEFYESRIQAKLRAGYQLTPRRRKK